MVLITQVKKILGLHIMTPVFVLLIRLQLKKMLTHRQNLVT